MPVRIKFTMCGPAAGPIAKFAAVTEACWRRRREARGTPTGSIWQELAGLGEDFVEFLEQELSKSSDPELRKQAQESAQSSSGTSGSAQSNFSQSSSSSDRYFALPLQIFLHPSNLFNAPGSCSPSNAAAFVERCSAACTHSTNQPFPVHIISLRAKVKSIC